jgi:capsular polysaccharide biosynthesis protein
MLDEAVICDDRFMRPYVYRSLFPDDSDSPQVARWLQLPVIEIERPSVLLLGHGITVYGHFLVEMLLRLFLAQRLLARHPVADVGYVISTAAPSWLRDILARHFDINSDQLIEFDPNKAQLLLRKAILPEYPSSGEKMSYHPGISRDFDSLAERVSDGSRLDPLRLFITRNQFRSRPGRWSCRNESELASIAANEFNYSIIAPEKFTWRNQVLLFRSAVRVVGEYGSALHSTLFSSEECRVVSLGITNLVQSQICTTRGQQQAYLGPHTTKEYEVDIEAFRQALRAADA